MGNNTSEGGMVHIRALCNAALETAEGIALPGLTKAKATYLRQSFHALRHEDRRKSKKIYPDFNDPMHGKSAYDPLLSTLVEDPNEPGFWILTIFRSEHITDSLVIIDKETGLKIDLKDFT